MHTHTTPFLGHQSAPTPTHPPIRLPQEALPQWERPTITPAGTRVYMVSSEWRSADAYTVDLIRQRCSCKSFSGHGHSTYPLDHPMRACKHIRDAQIYEAERAARASQAVDEMCGEAL